MWIDQTQVSFDVTWKISIQENQGSKRNISNGNYKIMELRET